MCMVFSLSSCLKMKEAPKEGLKKVNVEKIGNNAPKVDIPDDLKMRVELAQDGQTPLNQFAVLDEGNGDKIVDGQNVEIGYQVYSMPSKEKTFSSWSDITDSSQSDGSDDIDKIQSNWFPMNENNSDPNDLYPYLSGLCVGAVIVEAIPSQKATGQFSESVTGDDQGDKNQTEENDPSQIYDFTGKTFSLMVLEVLSVKTPLSKANGVLNQNIDPTLPKVIQSESGEPSIEFPNGKLSSYEKRRQIVKIGTGEQIKDTSTVILKYTGFFADGKKFTTSWNQERGVNIPFDNMLKGWQIALKGVRVGSQVMMILPPELAYGVEGNDKVPKNSTVIFVVDVLDILK